MKGELIEEMEDKSRMKKTTGEEIVVDTSWKKASRRIRNTVRRVSDLHGVELDQSLKGLALVLFVTLVFIIVIVFVDWFKLYLYFQDLIKIH